MPDKCKLTQLELIVIAIVSNYPDLGIMLGSHFSTPKLLMVIPEVSWVTATSTNTLARPTLGVIMSAKCKCVSSSDVP